MSMKREVKQTMKHDEMKSLLKSFKSYKQHFSVPEPDADFERRLMKSLHNSKEWNKVSLWDKVAAKLSIFSFEMTAFRLVGAACAVVVIFGAIRFAEHNVQGVGANNQFAQSENVRSHPELTSILQRGGEKALQAWITINGDLTAQNGPDAGSEKAPLSADEQKRILAELEKKWAPAL